MYQGNSLENSGAPTAKKPLSAIEQALLATRIQVVPAPAAQLQLAVPQPRVSPEDQQLLRRINLDLARMQSGFIPAHLRQDAQVQPTASSAIQFSAAGTSSQSSQSSSLRFNQPSESTSHDTDSSDDN